MKLKRSWELDGAERDYYDDICRRYGPWCKIFAGIGVPILAFRPVWPWMFDNLGPEGAGGVVVVVQIALWVWLGERLEDLLGRLATHRKFSM